jgi:hypothetical protein
MIMEAHGGVLRKRRFAIIHFYPSMYKIYVQTRLNGQNLKTTRQWRFSSSPAAFGCNNLPQYGNMKMENHVVIDFSFWNTQFARIMKFSVPSSETTIFCRQR